VIPVLGKSIILELPVSGHLPPPGHLFPEKYHPGHLICPWTKARVYRVRVGVAGVSVRASVRVVFGVEGAAKSGDKISYTSALHNRTL